MDTMTAEARSGLATRYLQAAEALAPLIEAEAEAAERDHHQSDKVVDALRQAGIYAMLLPADLGGGELSFHDAMLVTERISRADPSAGWCTMVAGVMQASVGGFMNDEGAHELYGKGPDVTVSGNGVPRGFARKVDGGWMIRGHWAYGSGIWHAEWVHSGCFVMDGEQMRMAPSGEPEIILAHHPKDSIELLGNWDTLGLRGTGSFDYGIKGGGELFVPDKFCYDFNASGTVRGGAQYGVGLAGLTAWGHTGWALGVGRRTLDELAHHARTRHDVFGRLADSPSFRQNFAMAEAKYRAARAFILETWKAISDTGARGEKPSVEQVALARLGMRHIHEVLSEITTFAHRTSRGVGLRNSVLQRCYRDAHSGTQHLLLADEIVQECGKALLGLPGKDAYWTMFAIRE